MKTERFAKYTWGVLGLNILVILWGAFVRATGSGAGCGAHWPTCDGQVMPLPESTEMLVEFTHRLTSGAALLAVVGLLIWAWRAWPAGHIVRKGAMASMVLIVVEALVGAGLVLFALVAHDTSLARPFVVAVHLINTFLLLGAITLTGWWATGGPPVHWRGQGRLGWAVAGAVIGLLILGASGAVTALGDTLVLAAGLRPEDSPLVAQLVELRIYHPLLAFATGGLVWLVWHLAQSHHPSPRLKQTGLLLLGVFVVQILLGGLNVALKAPVWIQIVHLLLADTLWILFVLLAAQA
ncbi:MAG: COX15/CtaA family protein, partial [Caldilineaceae bacterium]